MSAMFAYTVRCEISDAATADAWERWLVDTHLADVVAAGACSAELVRLDGNGDGDERIYEARYHFSDRAAFERYEQDHAPRLRAEGLSLFPLERGLRYSRSTGVTVRAVGEEGPGGPS